ncbi:SDR family oxidoreductase [Ilumatobacter sp.]|uniref:SDR family oxidoreductase n=1 Tax=Ilumatobacter sp. TaxID=1967498 RepID=UPI003B517D65
MIVSIVGAHGQIARLLTAKLAARGHSVRGLVRSEDQFDDLRSDGAEPVLCDVEAAGQDADDGPDEIDRALDGSDIVVFAAGSGPGSGAERKQTMDRDGAIASLRSAVRVGADRFVMISAMGADDPPLGVRGDDDDVFDVYLRAKAAADDAVREAEIAETIVRPGRLTDDEPAGSVELGTSVGRGEIPRADVAEVVAQLVETGRGRGATFELVGGALPIVDAILTLE